MSLLLDTDVAVFMRDRHPSILDAVALLDALPFLSVISRVELEGGVYAKPAFTVRRRAAVDMFLANLSILPFDDETLSGYRKIVEEIGFSRRKVVDRMIAATAIVHDLTLITINGKDFMDVPGLKLEIWPSP